MALCGSNMCGCAITSDTLDISGAGTGEDPWVIEGAFPTVCTSASRPLSPFDGQVIFETDTRKLAIWKNPPGTWVYQAAGVGLSASGIVVPANTTSSAVSWSSQSYDWGNYWASGTTITVPVGYGGPHLVSFATTASFVNDAASSVVLDFTGESRRFPASGLPPVGEGTSSLLEGTTLVDLAGGNTIQARISNFRDASLTYSTRLDVARVAW